MVEFIMDMDEAMEWNGSIPSTVYTTDSSDIADDEELSQSPENHKQYFDNSSCPGRTAGGTTTILSSSGGKLVASNLPWTDENEVTGLYTGEVERIVNVIKRSFIQPHGPGALIYQDGSARTCRWVHGKAAELWIPQTNIRGGNKSKKKKKQKKTQRKNASAKRSKSIPSRLTLGDAGTPNDMLIDFDPAQIDLLQRHDFAFVGRSDGRWTFAIIADRRDADHIRFVVDINGSTKTLSRKCWATAIRLVNPTPSSSRDAAVELEKKTELKVDNTCTFYTL